MSKYNFFISYANQDINLAKDIINSLTELNYSVFTDKDIPLGTAYNDTISNAIAQCEYFIPIVTDTYLSSTPSQRELEYAVTLSQGRALPIFPIFFTDHPLPPTLKSILSSYQSFFVHNSEDLQSVINSINQSVEYNAKVAKLYEKLVKYRDLKHPVRAAGTVSELIHITCSKWKISQINQRRQLSMEICRLLHQLEYNSCGYNKESKAFGYSMLGTVSKATNLLYGENDSDLFLSNIFFTAFAIRLIHYDWQIKTEGVDLGTGGDVFTGTIIPFPIKVHIEKQKPYIQAFRIAFDQMNSSSKIDTSYSAEEIDFINQTPSFFLDTELHSVSSYCPVNYDDKPISEDEEILQSIAKFMQEGNKLFDILQNHGVAGDFLKCLLTSYERLKNYCQIVGAKDVAADCVDRIIEIRDQIENSSPSKVSNDKAENGIKSLLGVTLDTGDQYDVFISFKSEDSSLAEKIYQYCHKHMKVPFWSKRSLPELSESEYSKAIYQALDNSTHFAVVISKLDYLFTDWVSQEMSIFHREKSEGRKPDNSNFIFIATDDLYDVIIKNNKKNIPIEYRGYQIIKMSEFERVLLQYII